MKSHRSSCQLGRLSEEVGWKYSDVIKKLELKRKIRSSAYYQKKKAIERLRVKAAESTKEKLAPVAADLRNYGYSV